MSIVIKCKDEALPLDGGDGVSWVVKRGDKYFAMHFACPDCPARYSMFVEGKKGPLVAMRFDTREKASLYASAMTGCRVFKRRKR